jgi:DNA-directed RNA polymerase beta' subunit
LYTEFKDIDSIRAILKETPLVHTTFKNYIKNVSYIEENSYIDWYDLYEKLYHCEIPRHNSCFEIELKMSELFKYKINVKDMAEKIMKSSNLFCCFPPTMTHLYIFCCESDISDSLVSEFITEIEKIEICGIEGVKTCDFRKIPGMDTLIIETSGSNLRELLSLPWINFKDSYSNHIWEIYSVLGIEAVYQFLTEEFERIVSADGSYMNLCHIYVMVSIMTFTGMPTPCSRYGMNDKMYSTLSMVSFEESLDKFVKASVFGSSDNINSVSASVICGKAAKLGTNFSELKYIDVECGGNDDDDLYF